MKLAVRDSQSVSLFRRRQIISRHQWTFLCHVHLLSIVLVLVNSGDEDPSTKQQQKPPQQQVASFGSPSTSNPVSDDEGIDNFTLSNDNKELTTKSVESENSHDLPASEQHDAELMNNDMSRHDNISFKQKTSEGDSTIDATKNSFIDEPDISCAADAIYAKWRTKNQFSGRLNLLRARNRFCYRTLITANQIELLIPDHECSSAITRTRLAPGSATRGVLLEVDILQTDDSPRKKNLLVLPQSEDDADDNQHETRQIEEITANDAANCSYVVNLVQANNLKDHAETAGTTTEIGNSDGHRRRSNIIRPITDNEQLSVGSQLLHEWSCPRMVRKGCLFVSNCLLNTGTEKVKVVDENGCHTDADLVPPLDYIQNTSIVREMEIYSEVANPFYYFDCQMELRLKNPMESDDLIKCPIPTCNNLSSK